MNILYYVHKVDNFFLNVAHLPCELIRSVKYISDQSKGTQSSTVDGTYFLAIHSAGPAPSFLEEQMTH